jgi:FdhE protein
MSIVQSINFMQPEEIATRELDDIVTSRLPNSSSIFKDRELRFRQLAVGHTMHDFLVFMADLANAQHLALNDDSIHASQLDAINLPSLEYLQECVKQGVPPLTLQGHELGDLWQKDLQFILGQLQKTVNKDTPVKKVLDDIAQMSEENLHLQAQKLLSGAILGLKMGTAPVIAAALQVYWMRLSSKTVKLYPSLQFPQIADPSSCPCCGSKPVASINTLDSDVGVSRYLHCSLCQTQWYLTRIKCSHCQSTKGIAYHSLIANEHNESSATPSADSGVSVETCDECKHYLKIVNMAKDAQVDPVADDLATLSLDLLISQEGFMRNGENLMLLFGASNDDSQVPIDRT